MVTIDIFTVGIFVTWIKLLIPFVIQVHFDGWNSCYDYWIDADSPDIPPHAKVQKPGILFNLLE